MTPAPAWYLDHGDVDDLATGCSWLGSGGGGDTHVLALTLKQLIRERGPVPVIDPRRLAPDALVFNVGFVGAPVTMHEKLFTHGEILDVVRTMQARLQGRATALMATEIGGGNGLAPFLAGALTGLPVLDADGMGRAFPLSDHVSYAIQGRSALPTVAAGEQGEIVVIEGGTNRQAERLVRAVSVVLGSKCFSADYPLSGDDVRACAVLDTPSLARLIGASIRRVSRESADPASALTRWFAEEHGLVMRKLFDGKVTGVEHEVREGWGFGSVSLQSLDGTGPAMTIAFQNEFLIARLGEETVATTPDIITVVDSWTLKAIPSDGIRYGQRVQVVGIQSPQVMATEAALRVVGPRAFGYPVDYRPLSLPPASAEAPAGTP
jgi:uncharacterized protein